MMYLLYLIFENVPNIWNKTCIAHFMVCVCFIDTTNLRSLIFRIKIMTFFSLFEINKVHMGILPA